MYQTSANPIPHPDLESLKKSKMFTELREKLIFYDLNGPTKDTTPQRPTQEKGVKKSSTERPARNKRCKDSVNYFSESMLKPIGLKTHHLIARAKTGETKTQNLERRMSLKVEIPTKKRKAEMVKRVRKPSSSNNSMALDKSNSKQMAAKVIRGTRPHIDPSNNSGKYSPALDTGVFPRGQTSRDFIPHPPPESTARDSMAEKKRTVDFPDETSKVLQRKTLLYSDPLYRPTGVATNREEPIDPRRLISILGDPVPSKRRKIPRKLDIFQARLNRANDNDGALKYVLRKGRVKSAHHKRPHFKHPRKAKTLKFKNWDQDKRTRGKVSSV